MTDFFAINTEMFTQVKCQWLISSLSDRAENTLNTLIHLNITEHRNHMAPTMQEDVQCTVYEIFLLRVEL